MWSLRGGGRCGSKRGLLKRHVIRTSLARAVIHMIYGNALLIRSFHMYTRHGSVAACLEREAKKMQMTMDASDLEMFVSQIGKTVSSFDIS